MTVRRRKRRSSRLFQFDKPYLAQHGILAGVDEAGRGPLAGPVVAAAVILPSSWRHSSLNDSKQIPAHTRQAIYEELQVVALAIGVGIVEVDEIDRINIRQASFSAMRLALAGLKMKPSHVLVDGFRIPSCDLPHTHVVHGDAMSAHIAAASVIAKVTRDAIMESLDKQWPAYGFCRHKGYGTPEHLSALLEHGPTPIHRKSFAPVSSIEHLKTLIISE